MIDYPIRQPEIETNHMIEWLIIDWLFDSSNGCHWLVDWLIDSTILWVHSTDQPCTEFHLSILRWLLIDWLIGWVRVISWHVISRPNNRATNQSVHRPIGGIVRLRAIDYSINQSIDQLSQLIPQFAQSETRSKCLGWLIDWFCGWLIVTGWLTGRLDDGSGWSIGRVIDRSASLNHHTLKWSLVGE